ncbi:MAG: hypothetical protein IKD94_00030 [Erysipelotrichaceae bacterium]|nr:hypothetical protein [Erysipelotrichaceae bacterium]
MKEKKKILIPLLIVLLAAGCFILAGYANSRSLPETGETEEEKTTQTVAVEERKQEKPENKQEPVREKEEPAKKESTESKATEKADSSSKPAEKQEQVSASSESKSGHYETRSELVKEAWDEQVETGCTQVCVQEAYDSEEVVYLEGAFYGPDMQEVYVCNGCGAIFTDSGIQSHIDNSDTCGGWHNDYVAVSESYWHNVDYRTIHHDAVYETRCEYKTVHHDAEYKEVKVWVGQ